MKIIDLDRSQREIIYEGLSGYDDEHIGYRMNFHISIGIEEDGKVVAGLVGEMFAFHMLHIGTMFVSEAYRRKGYGRMLMEEMERRAKEAGINTITLDTFDFQGRNFYPALGYTEIGSFRNDDDNYEQFYFYKRI